MEKNLEQRITDVLKRTGVKFKKDAALGGISPDFTIHTQDGRIVVLQAKVWGGAPGSVSRAVQQAERYKATTGANDVYVVVDGIERGRPTKGVLTEKSLEESLLEILQPKEKAPAVKPVTLAETKKTIFAAMPFAGEYDDTYLVAMAPAAEAIGAVCDRVDKIPSTNDIVDEIKRLIKKSSVIIADLSEAKPNVLYEVGYAHGLGKAVIQICSTPLKDLPFDVQHNPTIAYSKGQTIRLKDELVRALKAYK